MRNSIEQITEDLELTKKDLSQKIGQIEDHVKSSIQETKNIFSNKVQSIKDATNIKHVVEKQPLLVVGGAVIAGFLATYYLNTKSTRPARLKPVLQPKDSSHFIEKLSGQFKPQINMVKGMAFHSFANLIGDWALRKFPNFKAEIQQIVDSTNLNQNAEPASHNVTAQGQEKSHAESHQYTALPEDTYHKDTLV